MSEKNLEMGRYEYVLDFAKTWFVLLKKLFKTKEDLEEFKKVIANHSFIGESVGDKTHQHIKIYEERDIIFYGIVNNQKLLSENCLSLSKSFELFKKFNLSYTEISPSPKFNTLEELFAYMNEQYDVVFDKSLQESGEGNVVYFSCDKNGDESIKGLAKLKTFDYRYLRKVREKLKTIPPKVDRATIEKEVHKRFNDIKKKKEKKKKGKKEEEDDKEEIIKINRKIDNELKDKNEERNTRISRIIKKVKNESHDLLKEVPKSKFNSDKILLKEYFDFGEYLINYWAIDGKNYFDVFASFIEIMKEKFKAKTEINDLLVNEIRKKFEGLISNENEENEDEGKEEDPKE